MTSLIVSGVFLLMHHNSQNSVMAGSYEEYISGEVVKFKHTFLIRHSKAVAESFQKVMNSFQNEKVSFYTETIGFDKMYEAVKRNTDTNPTVVCAKDLLGTPRSIQLLHSVCS